MRHGQEPLYFSLGELFFADPLPKEDSQLDNTVDINWERKVCWFTVNLKFFYICTSLHNTSGFYFLPLAPYINIAQSLQSRTAHWSAFIMSPAFYLSGLRNVVLDDELLLPPLLPRLLLRQGKNSRGLAICVLGAGLNEHETLQLDDCLLLCFQKGSNKKLHWLPVISSYHIRSFRI